MDDLDREHVREWLRRKHPTDDAGITGSLESCPLANYLKERFNDQDVEVQADRYLLLGAYRILPHWAHDYVNRIDHYPGPRTHCGAPFEDVAITAGAALTLLDQVEEYDDDDDDD